jgi:phage-related protein
MILAAALIIPGTVTVAATGEQLSLRMKIVTSTLFPFYAGYKGSVFTVKSLKWLPRYLVEVVQKLVSMIPKMYGGFRKVLVSIWEHISTPIMYVGRKLINVTSRIVRALFDFTLEVGTTVVRTIRALYIIITSVSSRIVAKLRVTLECIGNTIIEILVVAADILSVVIDPLRRFLQALVYHTKEIVVSIQAFFAKMRDWISPFLSQLKELLLNAAKKALVHVLEVLWWLVKKIFVVISFVYDTLCSLYSKLATGIRFIWHRFTTIFWSVVDIMRESFIFVWNLLNDILFMPVYEAVFTVAKAIWNVVANNYEVIMKILYDVWTMCYQSLLNQIWILKESIVTLFAEMREVFIVTLDTMTTAMWQSIDAVQTILQQCYEASMNILN